MKSIRIIAAAGMATVALGAGAALTSGATAHADGDQTTTKPPPRPHAKALIANCSGKAALGFLSRGTDFQNVNAGTSAEVEGSQWSVKGPKKRKDVVLVTLTSMASSGGAGELTSVALVKDGVGGTSKYYTYNGVLDQAAVQFCTKIGKGQHTLAVRVTDDGGGASTLYYPTVTYQRFD